MTKALVVFDSKFGNTERIARALAAGLKEQKVEADCVGVGQVRIDRLKEYGLLAIGGPTQYGTISAPMNVFLGRVPEAAVKGKKGFAFDTRYEDERAGSAAKEIQARMSELRMEILKPHASAIVLGGEGPLAKGAEETFRRLGAELAMLVP